MEGMEADNYDYFTYVNLYSKIRTKYYRFVFKSREPVEELDGILSSLPADSPEGPGGIQQGVPCADPRGLDGRDQGDL